LPCRAAHTIPAKESCCPFRFGVIGSNEFLVGPGPLVPEALVQHNRQICLGLTETSRWQLAQIPTG
jgi:hypothetical protein